ncbi:MAG: PilZ domain-containing protein [Magnetococcales bacterium]|nr:PilZ domain-containing protein [Magnetococcales bacterium]NGZ28786.1 PilZ domain-containing protein [Magnetococcales bacterium]
MTAELPTTPPSAPLASLEKIRSEDRFSYARSMIFSDQHGEKWPGTTLDVSLNGAFLKTNRATAGIQVGDHGVVEVEMEQGNGHYMVTIPCQVARVAPHGLGLSFEDME